MPLLPHRSPIAIHFGSLDTRVLQLESRGRGWSVRTARSFATSGKNRHWKASGLIKAESRRMRLFGRDVTAAMSGQEVAVALVPIDDGNRGRMQDTFRETASTAIKDEEGVVYRYLPLSTHTHTNGSSEEFLLLSVGASEIRRCNEAIKTIGARAVSLEMNAFAIARALSAARSDIEHPWSFLHIGFEHSLFGIIHEGEICFLKPLQVDGQRLLQTVERSLGGGAEEVGSESALDLITSFEGDATTMSFDGGGEESPGAGFVASQAEAGSGGGTTATLRRLNESATGRAIEILNGLRMESEAMAQEIRACARHFANRQKGAKIQDIVVAGFGAAIPEVVNALGKALLMDTHFARPFTDLNVKAPEEILREEYLWCTALGLAMRGYE